MTKRVSTMALRDWDITKNIKIIEWLKSELLNSVAGLFNALINGAKETSGDAIKAGISNIIIVSYLLAKRLGFAFAQIDINIENKLKAGIEEEHEIEKNFNDLSNLLKHFELNRTERGLEG